MTTETAEAGPSRVGLRRVEPYWHEYRTNCKMRWAGRTLLEVFVTEFRDRTSEYYQWAIYKGYCRVNGVKTAPSYILKMSDQIQHKMHRHEAPITAEPIRILHRDDEKGRLVIVKPGSIPVHPAGRHHKTTLVEMLKNDHGIENVATSNRLDRLTSGIMICTTKKEAAHELAEQFAMSKVQKAYVCRVRGKFPKGETFVEEPLLIVDRQTGVSIIHPLGKYAATVFHHMWYDAQTNTTAVFCRPITGRTHQIRVHVQWLGHPIVNDPVYASSAWNEHSPQFYKSLPLKLDRWKVDPGSTLSVYGAQEIDELIAALKAGRDDREDWARWRDEMLFSQMLKQNGLEVEDVPGPNGIKPSELRGERHQCDDRAEIDMNNLQNDQFCEECYVPLIPDPKPEELFIYLHAIKYETDSWSYQDRLPWWARRAWPDPILEEDTESWDGFVVPNMRDRSFEIRPDRRAKTANGIQKESKSSSIPAQPFSLVDVCEKGAEAISVAGLNAFQPATVFEVFCGLEDVAAQDVEFRLAESLGRKVVPSNCISYTRHTGHVIVPSGRLADAALRLYRDAQINCAKNAYIEIAQTTIPQDTLSELAKEKRESQLLISNANRARKLSKRGESVSDMLSGKDVDSLPTQSSELPRTPAEDDILAAMEEAWIGLAKHRDVAFRFWKEAVAFKEISAHRADAVDEHTFRATVDRSGYAMTTLTSVTFERELGNLVWRWLNPGRGAEDEVWKVNLTAAHLDVTLKLLAGPQNLNPHWRVRDTNPPGQFHFLIYVPQKHAPVHRPRDIPNNLIHGGTALARYRGYTLSLLVPLPERLLHGDLSNGEPFRIWEPCAGSGSFLVELVHSLRRRGIPHQVFASEISKVDTDKAQSMLDICDAKVAKLTSLDATDAEGSAEFVCGEAQLDSIVTDLPWGRRVLNHMSIAKLYPALLHTFCRVLKPGGTVLVMTADHRALLRALKLQEADARKRDTGWCFHLEDLNSCKPHAASSDEVYEAQSSAGITNEELLERRIRIVQCGYMVGVVLLRKVALDS